MVMVGAYLQQHRNAAGLTQQDVADELGVVARTVSDWEAGRYSPSFDLMARFVRLINGRIEEVTKLLFDDENQGSRRAEFEELVATLPDSEIDNAIRVIRELRADPNRGAVVQRPKRTRRRKTPDQSLL